MIQKTWKGMIPDPGKFLALRAETPKFLKVILGAAFIITGFFIWWLLTAGVEPEERIISPVILPSPGEVVSSFHSLWFERALSRSIVQSLARVSLGFLIAAAVCLPLGVLMGAFGPIKAFFSPLSLIGGYLPIAALVPLTLSWFGTGELQKIMFLAIASFVYLLPLTIKAVDEVDDVYLNTASTLGASKSDVIKKVLLPIALPDVFNSMRLAFGVGWTYIILAEMVDAQRGLGALIITSQRRGPREHIYLVLVIIILIAFVVDKLWVMLGKILFPYKRAR